jgi:zinc transport system ATP-binding protein
MTQASAADPLLSISDLTIRFGADAVLSNISMSVQRGTLHAVVGDNGAGKTTLLSAILGQTVFTGRIVARWQGSGRIGFVPQSFHADRTLPVSVGDFLALARQNRPVCLGVEAGARRRIAALLDHVGLGGFERRQLSMLSGGELRRVLLANALDPLPELLLLDEPAAGLDHTSAVWLDETLAAIKPDVTTVMVSHDSAQVTRVADQVTRLERRGA